MKRHVVLLFLIILSLIVFSNQIPIKHIEAQEKKKSDDKKKDPPGPPVVRNKDRDQRVYRGINSTQATSEILTSDEKSFLELSSKKISDLQPHVPATMIRNDKDTIAESLREIESKYEKKGFDNSNIRSAIFFSWATLRGDILNPEEKLERKVFVSFAKKLGLLKILTDPAGARVKIDNIDRPETTNISFWLVGGQYRIQITKDGYVPINEECDVKELDVTEVKRVLEKKNE